MKFYEIISLSCRFSNGTFIEYKTFFPTFLRHIMYRKVPWLVSSLWQITYRKYVAKFYLELLNFFDHSRLE